MKKIWIAFVLLNGFLTNASAQKFGHINTDDLLNMMPEKKVADSTLGAYQNFLAYQDSVMVIEYQTKAKDFQMNSKTWRPELVEIKQSELADLEQRITTFEQGANDKLMGKKDDLYNPIIAKAKKAIEDVGKENGFSYIFDTGAGTVLFSQDADDILPLVKKKLGLK